MKRRDLIAQLEQLGCYLIRHGGKHDIYHNPNTGRTERVHLSFVRLILRIDH